MRHARDAAESVGILLASKIKPSTIDSLVFILFCLPLSVSGLCRHLAQFVSSRLHGDAFDRTHLAQNI